MPRRTRPPSGSWRGAAPCMASTAGASVRRDHALHRVSIALADFSEIAPIPIIVPDRADDLGVQAGGRVGQKVHGEVGGTLGRRASCALLLEGIVVRVEAGSLRSRRQHI